MAHVHVEHMVPGVGPYYGDVGGMQDIFFPEWIVGRVEGDEHFYVFVVPGVGLPAIPFVDGCGEVNGQAMGGGVRWVVDDEARRKGRPAIVIENCVAEEMDEPGPFRILVVVAGDMEAEPAASVLHVLLKGGALCFTVGKVIEPDDDLVFF